DVAVGEDTTVGRGQDVAVGRGGRCVARHLDRGCRRAGVAAQLGIVVELRPSTLLIDRGSRSAGAVDLPVGDDGARGLVADTRDADVAVGVVGDQRRVLVTRVLATGER